MSTDDSLSDIAKAICSRRGLTFVSSVGSGAFKRSFRVRGSDNLDRALKVYRRSGVSPRTEREVCAIRRCDHPGIARFELIDTWVEGDHEFMYSIEEFLAGGTLNERLAKGPLPLVDLLVLGSSLIDAVTHIASLGLVHRDLKPDNIMFREIGGSPVIVDFGLVRDLTQTSLTKTWALQGPGTPFFAAPEQLLNEKHLIDWRTDQFALGIVLGLSATGQHPFSAPGLHPEEVVERVARRELASSIFLEWAKANGMGVLVRMLAPWPVERFRTPELLQVEWRRREKS